MNISLLIAHNLYNSKHLLQTNYAGGCCHLQKSTKFFCKINCYVVHNICLRFKNMPFHRLILQDPSDDD